MGLGLISIYSFTCGLISVNRSSKKTSSKQPSKNKSDKGQAILAGALQVFTKHGYAAASMDRIASAAGVSKPTLYS
ncbi:MAG: TetR/AcrR family transcriptional regulator, partial [Spirulinaceae cyanobacterium]